MSEEDANTNEKTKGSGPRFIRLPFAPMGLDARALTHTAMLPEGLTEEQEERKRMRTNMTGQYISLNVEHIVSVAPFINRAPDMIAKYGVTSPNRCRVSTTSAYYFIDMAPEIVTAMIVSDDKLSADDWFALYSAKMANGPERHINGMLVSYLEGDDQ